MERQVPQVPLRDGNVVPQLGFGTARLAAADSRRLTELAIETGYRAFDTSPAQGNEDGVGRAIRGSGIDRAAFTIASQLPPGLAGRDDTLRAFDSIMKALGLDRLDLLVLAGASPEAWKTLADLQQQGHVRSLGVASLDRPTLEKLIAETEISPAVHRFSLHFHSQQRDIRGFHTRRNIRLESRFPFGPDGSLDDGTLMAIAAKHSRTAAQIAIRWHLQEGLLLSPGTSRPARIAENFGVLDFELDAEDMYRIEAIDGTADDRLDSAPAPLPAG